MASHGIPAQWVHTRLFGIQSVAPTAVLFTNAGDVISHAVYPLASKVALNPPEGNEDASGSPLISSFPENSSKTFPFSFGADFDSPIFHLICNYICNLK